MFKLEFERRCIGLLNPCDFSIKSFRTAALHMHAPELPPFTQRKLHKVKYDGREDDDDKNEPHD